MHRPSYPDEIIELIQKEAGLKSGAPVADIGSGTGILTRLLLQAGCAVWAVEPNAAMRAAAEADLANFPLFHSIDAKAEATGLPDESFAAITVAQAFHWFEPAAVHQEFRRLLQPRGLVFIIRNERSGDATPFARDYESLLQSLGDKYHSVRHRDAAASAARLREFFSGNLRTASFDNPQTLDWYGLRGRFLSSSYVPAAGEPGHDEILAALETIYRKQARDGKVTLEQQTEVSFGIL